MSEESTVKVHFKKIHVIVIAVVVVLAIASFYLLSHNNSSISVKSGDNVTVFYSLWLSNGTLVQSNFNSTPFSFIAGSSQVIKGFSNAVIGMKEGQTKNVTLSPSEAYGNINNSLIITVPRADFGNNSIAVGEQVSNGNGAAGVITALNSTNVTVNFNPPLAGKTLIFEIKVIKIN
ncbi:MAG: peptidylprolyl isomerase [Candidatus Parvarchaeota archaeon]|nr:peptidylprolyl isomerase [Candidatus Parvarchaeota archaeon]